MKKILTILAFCIAAIAVAQDKKDSKEAVLNDITQDVCGCIGEKSAENLTSEEVEIQLGLCMIKSYGKYKERLDKYMVVSLDDGNSLEMLGQEIGLKMLEICPDTFMTFAKGLIEDEISEEYNTQSQGSNTTVLGEVVEIEKDQFNTIVFKGQNKREYKLLWLEYFEGQELLSDVKELKKSTIRLSYENKEMYDPKLKDYRTYKIVRKLEVVN